MQTKFQLIQLIVIAPPLIGTSLHTALRAVAAEQGVPQRHSEIINKHINTALSRGHCSLPPMVRTQLTVAFLLLGLQLGMHGAQARRNPHTDHDLMPGRCLEAAVGGAETRLYCCCFWPASLAELPSLVFPGFCCCMQVGWAVTISLLTSV